MAQQANSDPEQARASMRDALVDLADRMLWPLLSAPGSAPNLVLSPLSNLVALAALQLGVPTAARHGLPEPFATLTQVDDAALAAALAPMSDVASGRDASSEFLMANGLWHLPGIAIDPVFRRRAQAIFGVETDEAAPAQLVARVNGWVADRTRGRVPTLLDGSAANAELVLANALYFKGTWRKPFDPALTVEAPFTTDDGQTLAVHMMSASLDATVLNTDGMSGVMLPYLGGQFALAALLPDPGLSQTALRGAVRRMLAAAVGAPEISVARTQRPVRLKLPRFATSTSVELLEPLIDVGFGPLLGPGVDLSGIAPRLRAPQSVAHRTDMEVNEAGTVASAATAIVVGRSQPLPPIELTFDRPFFVALVHFDAEALVFLGRIGHPSSAGPTAAIRTRTISQDAPTTAIDAFGPAAIIAALSKSDGRIVLPIRFATGSTRLTQDHRAVLALVAEALRDPALAGARVRIEGHTERDGAARANRRLSQRRATAVRRVLIQDFLVAPSRMTASGYGSARLLKPDAPEDTANRRVELVRIG